MSTNVDVAARRGWYHGWNIVAICIFVQVASNGLSINAFSLFLQGWSTELHAPFSTFQLGIAALGLMSAFYSPVLGGLADRKPARWLIGAGVAGVAVFYVAISFVTAAWQMIVLYGVLFPAALCLASALVANAVISRWFVRHRGLALGLSAFGMGLAGILLPPIVVALLPDFGWRLIWRAGGVLVAVILVPLVLMLVRDRPREGEGLYYLTGPEGTPALHGHGHAPGGGLSWKKVLGRRNFWILVIVYLPIMAIYGGGAQNLAPVVMSHGLGQDAAAGLLSVLNVTYVLSTLVLGLAADRYGARLPFFGLALVVGLGSALLAFGQGFAMNFLGAALIGTGGGMFPLLATALATEFGTENFGRAFGLAMAFVPLTALSAFAIAASQEQTGSYVPALGGFAILALLGGLLCLFFLRQPSPRPA